MAESILAGTLFYFFGLGILSILLVEQERRTPEEQRNFDEDIVPFLL